MKKIINWLKSLFSPKELVSEKIVKKTLKTKKGSGSSKSTFTKSGNSKAAVSTPKKRKPRTSGMSKGAIKK